VVASAGSVTSKIACAIQHRTEVLMVRCPFVSHHKHSDERVSIIIPKIQIICSDELLFVCFNTGVGLWYLRIQTMNLRFLLLKRILSSERHGTRQQNATWFLSPVLDKVEMSLTARRATSLQIVQKHQLVMS
jgi:hypothetical protein